MLSVCTTLRYPLRRYVHTYHRKLLDLVTRGVMYAKYTILTVICVRDRNAKPWWEHVCGSAGCDKER
jgi:hypothetical protein